MGSIYSSMQFQLWAVVNGTTVDLVQFACNYEMNTIPKCQAVLPVGYRVLPPFAPSTAYQATQGVQVQVPLTVYCTVKFCGGQNQPTMPSNGTYTIFQGYVTGVGYRRTYNGYSMTIEGTHWLSDLSYASIMSQNSSPMNPTQLSFNAALLPNAGGFGDKACVVITTAMTLASPANISTDLWGKVIQPWFLQLASANRMNRAALGALNINNDTSNGDVATALRRVNGVPLPVDLATFRADTAMLATSIGADLSGDQNPAAVGARMARQTFWDKLIGEICPTYMFNIVPYPTQAKAVPFIPGLRDVWDPAGEGVTFRGRDIEVQDMRCQLPRQIRALCIFAGINFQAGGMLPNNPDNPILNMNNARVGGAFEASANSGIVLFKECPGFLWKVPCIHQFTNAVTQVRGNALHPGAGQRPQGPMPDKAAQGAFTMLDAVAHCWYVKEVLHNRYGDISTCVRFDVAPGSSVKFEGTSGSFNGSPQYLYGQVGRVAHYFDAQQQQCRTNFRIANVHTDAEHQLDQFTTANHPLYATTWPGDKHITQS